MPSYDTPSKRETELLIVYQLRLLDQHQVSTPRIQQPQLTATRFRYKPISLPPQSCVLPVSLQPIILILLLLLPRRPLRVAIMALHCLLAVHYQATARAPHVSSCLLSSLALITMLLTTAFQVQHRSRICTHGIL